MCKILGLGLELSLFGWICLISGASWYEDLTTMGEIVQANVDFRWLRNLLHLHYIFGRKSYRLRVGDLI